MDGKIWKKLFDRVWVPLVLFLKILDFVPVDTFPEYELQTLKLFPSVISHWEIAFQISSLKNYFEQHTTREGFGLAENRWVEFHDCVCDCATGEVRSGAGPARRAFIFSERVGKEWFCPGRHVSGIDENKVRQGSYRDISNVKNPREQWFVSWWLFELLFMPGACWLCRIRERENASRQTQDGPSGICCLRFIL